MPFEAHFFSAIVVNRLENSARQWWLKRMALVSAASIGPSLAACGRRLGSTAIVLTKEEAESAAGLLPPMDGWPLSRLGRLLLLRELCCREAPISHEQLLLNCYRRGDNSERQDVLHALPYLPDPDRFLAVAVDACRSHVQGIFEAIACENPYPAKFFPDDSFHQLVLKAFFTEVATARILDLPRRRSAELTRMAQGYASERRAAGRSVPEDLDYVIGVG